MLQLTMILFKQPEEELLAKTMGFQDYASKYCCVNSTFFGSTVSKIFYFSCTVVALDFSATTTILVGNTDVYFRQFHRNALLISAKTGQKVVVRMSFV